MMGKARLLIVEDDQDISNMLKIYFSGHDFEVDTALRGAEALEKTRQNLPHLIVLDIMLPDIDGFEVCRILRTHTRTSHVPIIFLTQKDERSDKLQGLELGADDYVTKPFDIEELKLRVQRAITRAEQQSLTDPRSGLPSGRLIEEQLRRIIRLGDWSFMDIRILNLEAFRDVYGFVAADNVLRFTAMLLGEVVDELGTLNDFIGHAGGDNFVVITTQEASKEIQRKLIDRFANEVLAHYSFIDREQGYILTEASDGSQQKAPMMTLVVGEVSPREYDFSDIRDITELAAEARRQN
ncbi:MAG: response regulator, partial [Anaerolineae bacterium]|nr:response regulator [Anaerolineae bacterium]